MTDEEIIELAEKTREEKYCKKYIYKERGKQYCYLDCVFSDGNYGCRPQEYYTSFLDGFKAALNEICKDVDKHVCKITFLDTGKDD